MKNHLPDFSTARVLVVGDVMLDRYWYGPTQRISPEAPVPVVKVEAREDLPGGAGNVALNLAKLGASVCLLGVVGQDEPAQILEDRLQKAGVSSFLMSSSAATTITKLRIISRNQQLLRLDCEEPLEMALPPDFSERFVELLMRSDLVVFSDYAKGTLHEVQLLIRLAREAGKVVLVDPKNPNVEIYRGATVMTPNMAEFEGMVGPCPDEESLREKGLALIRRLEQQALLVTRGEAGMTLIAPGQSVLHLSSHASEVYDVTGAGDTVIAVLAGSLAAEATLEESVALANLAAGIVVTKLGAAQVTVDELKKGAGGQDDFSNGVVSEDQLVQAVRQAQDRGERVVMTNGCFDILHAGHVAYLHKARSLGDMLVVAVNDDASVRKLKGAGRPVNRLEQRMVVLAALAAVDWVTPFSEATPERLICRVRPQVLVKGADYRPEEIAGGDCVRRSGGEVLVIDLVEGVSTTAILDAALERKSDF